MNEINKTLYIPLYGKAYVSKKGIILQDTHAEYIWEKEGIPLKGKSKNKYLAYYMGMRSAVFDNWVKQQMQKHPEALILHLGCGMDSRCIRVNNTTHLWYDIDFSSVIIERKKYFVENDLYHMISSDLNDQDCFASIEKNKDVIVVMEGISMYFSSTQLQDLFSRLETHFNHVYLLMDCYSSFAAKASKYKNPINDVGVHTVYGLDDPNLLCKSLKMQYIEEKDMTPDFYIQQLDKGEQLVFKKLYSGNFARNLYHMYEFEKKEDACSKN